MIKFFKLNERGDDEASESFRLLIAFAIAAAVLVIIIVMVGRVNHQSILISTAKFEEGFISASKGPGISTITPFVIEDVMLSGIISKDRLTYLSGYSSECIIIESGPGFENTGGKYVSVLKKYIKTDVIVYCGFGNDLHANQFVNEDDCPTYCVLFMNKSAPTSIYE